MLKAHTDKEIVVNAYREYKRDWFNTQKDFVDFLHTGSDLVIYGTPNQSDMGIISRFLQGRQNAPIKLANKELSLTNDDFNPKNPYQVFFLNTSDTAVKNNLQIHHRFLYGLIDNYNEVFNNLSKESFSRVGDVESPNEFSEWSDVLPDLPVSDIIITDPYLFDENNGNKPINENYYRLLDEIANKYNLNSLIVFAYKIDYNLRCTIEAKSKKTLGDKVSFYLLSFSKVIEHDRYIFMNYTYVNAGSSMTYYNDDGVVDVKSSSKIEVFPICREKNFNIAQDILRKLKDEMDNLKIEKSLNPKINSNLFFFLEENNQ